jgi:hypothetical protein
MFSAIMTGPEIEKMDPSCLSPLALLAFEGAIWSFSRENEGDQWGRELTDLPEEQACQWL